MNKERFLAELRRQLSGLPQRELEERLSFYSEMIDDRMEDGIPEEEAVAEIGGVDSVREQIASEIPLTALVREKVRPGRRLKVWEIVLLVLGAPLWLPLLIAAAAVILAVYLVLWAAAVCVYAADLSLAACAVAGFAGGFLYLKNGNPAGALFSLGAGLTCAGLAILLFFASTGISKAILRLTRRALLGIKTSIIGKED